MRSKAACDLCSAMPCASFFFLDIKSAARPYLPSERRACWLTDRVPTGHSIAPINYERQVMFQRRAVRDDSRPAKCCCTSSNLTEKHENQHDYKNQSQPATWTVSPASAVRPSRNRT